MSRAKQLLELLAEFSRPELAFIINCKRCKSRDNVEERIRKALTDNGWLVGRIYVRKLGAGDWDVRVETDAPPHDAKQALSKAFDHVASPEDIFPGA